MQYDMVSLGIKQVCVARCTTHLGSPPHELSKILNHLENDVTAIYNQHSYDTEKRVVLELWEKKLLDIVSENDQPIDKSNLSKQIQLPGNGK